MHAYCSNVIRVCFKRRDLFCSIVIEDAELKVIGASDDPVLASDEAAGADGYVGYLKGFDSGAGFVGPNVNMARVERGEDPWF
jgi:hypothetical protein